VSNRPAYKTVEMPGIEESGDDMWDYMPEVATEDLRLVSKNPYRPAEIDAD
jgi:hypothetical protein